MLFPSTLRSLLSSGMRCLGSYTVGVQKRIWATEEDLGVPHMQDIEIGIFLPSCPLKPLFLPSTDLQLDRFSLPLPFLPKLHPSYSLPLHTLPTLA